MPEAFFPKKEQNELAQQLLLLVFILLKKNVKVLVCFTLLRVLL